MNDLPALPRSVSSSSNGWYLRSTFGTVDVPMFL